MAYKWSDAVLGADLPMPPTTKLSLATLAKFANEKTGLAWPSVETIATLVGIHPRNTTNHLAVLIAGGWIMVVAGGKGGRPRNGTGGLSTVYRINVDKIRKHVKPRRQRRGLSAGNHDAAIVVDVEPTGQITTTICTENHVASAQTTTMPAPGESVIESRSESDIEGRDVVVNAARAGDRQEPDTGNGAIAKTAGQRRNGTGGQHWDDPKWVAETARTFETPRRLNESSADWKDRVFDVVRRQRLGMR